MKGKWNIARQEACLRMKSPLGGQLDRAECYTVSSKSKGISRVDKFLHDIRQADSAKAKDALWRVLCDEVNKPKETK